MVSQLLINEPPLQVLPTLAQRIGLNEAIILQQMHYWLNPQFNQNHFNDRYWVFNTFEQWQKQFPFWSERTLQRIMANLEESGLVISFVTRSFKRVKYYTIDYGRLNQLQQKEQSLNDSGIAVNDTQQIQGFFQSSQTVDVEDETLAPPITTDCRYPERQDDGIDDGTLAPPRPTVCRLRSGQPDGTDHGSLSLSLTEITPEITSEASLHPPQTPPSGFGEPTDSREEEEEPDNLAEAMPNPQTQPNICLQSIKPEEKEGNKDVSPRTAGHDIPAFMLEVWNQTVQATLHPGTQAYLTPQRKTRLMEFWKTVLHSEKGNPKPESWQNYCSLVAKSQFLTGNNSTGFKVTLDWVLNPLNACKVLEGAFFDRPALIWRNPSPRPGSPSPVLLANPLSWEEFEQFLSQAIPDGPYAKEWLKVSLPLAKAISQLKYTAWFSRVTLSGITGTVATLAVEGSFFKEYINNHFRDILLRAIQAVYPSISCLALELVSKKGDCA